jgi:hypothetical protein
MYYSGLVAWCAKVACRNVYPIPRRNSRPRLETLEPRYALTGNVIIQDNFEAGHPSPNWSFIHNPDGGDGVVAGIAHDGNKSYRIRYDRDEDSGKLEFYDLPRRDEYYARYWQMYPDGFVQRNLKQAHFYHESGATLFLSLWGDIDGNQDPNQVQAATTFYPYEGGESAIYSAFPIRAGEWFKTAFYMKLNTPGQANGIYQLWHNDTLVVNRNNVSYRTTDVVPIGGWIGGNYSGAGDAPKPFDRYIDDILIASNPKDDMPTPPTLSVSDAQVVEGDPSIGQPRSLSFTVTLSSTAASFPNVRVNYATANGNAQAGIDYTSVSGQRTLTSTMRSFTVAVPIRPDTLKETDEMLFLRLSTPIGATISDGEGKGTIIDDDTPQLLVNDVSIAEGNSGIKQMPITFTLSKVATHAVSFRATTYAGSAIADQDFQTRSQVLSIPRGNRTATFNVGINGDTRLESDETFTVVISEVVGANVTKSKVTATIANDDLPLPAAADKPAVVRNGHEWYLDLAGNGYLAERTIGFGLPGDRHFSADMNGDLREELVVARNNTARGGIDWYIDYNGDGNLGEAVVEFGLLGDIPLIGDFDMNGRDDLAAGRWNAVRRSYDWYLDLAGDGYLAEKIIGYGFAGDMFLTGDFNGDRRDEIIAVRKDNITGGLVWHFDLLGNGGNAELIRAYGLIGDVPVIGDWNGDGRGDDMAVVRRNTKRGGLDWYFDLLGNGGSEELILEFGLLGDVPVGGKWRP